MGTRENQNNQLNTTDSHRNNMTDYQKNDDSVMTDKNENGRSHNSHIEERH